MRNNQHQGVYGATLASTFRVEASGCLTTDWPFQSRFAVTRVRSDVPLTDYTDPLPSQPVIFIGVALHTVLEKNFKHTFDDKPTKVPSFSKFTSSIFDVRANPRVWVGTGFDYLNFHVPLAGINEIARDHNLSPIDTFRPGFGQCDITMAQFAKTFLPLIRPDSPVSLLALDQVSLLVGAHVLNRYAGLRHIPVAPTGGLAPWQMRRAQEILREHLDGNVRVQYLAQECGLSVSHFARAFRVSFGLSPIQWLIRQRVNLAQELLRNNKLTLSQIATQAGFADQSALARTFSKQIGTSPGRWRRETLGVDGASSY